MLFRSNTVQDARTWEKALRKVEAALVVCGRNPQHVVGNHLNACPWCQRTNFLGGLDPFPRPGSPSTQQRKPTAAKAISSAARPRFRPRQVRQLGPPQYQTVQFAQLPPGNLCVPHFGLILWLIIVGLLLILAKTCSHTGIDAASVRGPSVLIVTLMGYPNVGEAGSFTSGAYRKGEIR